MQTENSTLLSFLSYRKHSLWTNALLVTILLTASVSCDEEEEKKYVGTYTLSNGEVSFESQNTTFTYDGEVILEDLSNIGTINGVEINYSMTFTEAAARLNGETDVTISRSTNSVRIDGSVYSDALADPKESTFSDNNGVLTISNMPIKSHLQELANTTYPVKEAKVKFTLTKKK